MSKRKHSKFKFDRRIGENLWNNPRSSVIACSNPPGQHGAKIKTKTSDFCVRMIAKQKLKFYYSNLTESKLRKLYKKALRYGGNASHNLVRLLESRLDVLVYRVGLVTSLFAARQFVSHGHVLVNNIRVTICSYMCKSGDVLRVAPKAINLLAVKTSVLNACSRAPRYIHSDYKHLVFKLINTPSVDDIEYANSMCLDLVMEYYQGLN
ncbi:MAG: 30S ribosomal subunit protein S4 [Candidatus Hodgkinia cicadicola]|nr:MAG: 30S ribosomal subunit protein S4 [Candidatus Hodgkinia cicadicola]